MDVQFGSQQFKIWKFQNHKKLKIYSCEISFGYINCKKYNASNESKNGDTICDKNSIWTLETYYYWLTSCHVLLSSTPQGTLKCHVHALQRRCAPYTGFAYLVAMNSFLSLLVLLLLAGTFYMTFWYPLAYKHPTQ